MVDAAERQVVSAKKEGADRSANRAGDLFITHAMPKRNRKEGGKCFFSMNLATWLTLMKAIPPRKSARLEAISRTTALSIPDKKQHGRRTKTPRALPSPSRSSSIKRHVSLFLLISYLLTGTVPPYLAQRRQHEAVERHQSAELPCEATNRSAQPSSQPREQLRKISATVTQPSPRM